MCSARIYNHTNQRTSCYTQICHTGRNMHLTLEVLRMDCGPDERKCASQCLQPFVSVDHSPRNRCRNDQQSFMCHDQQCKIPILTNEMSDDKNQCHDACCALLDIVSNTASHSRVITVGYTTHHSTSGRNIVFWTKKNLNWNITHHM
jgi:hypothetical protein